MKTATSLLLMGIVLACTTAFAGEIAGQVKTLKGSASIERSGERIPANIGFPILASDRIVTTSGSSIGITLRDNTMLTAGPDSVLELSKYSFDSTTHGGALDASVRKGTLAVISGKLAKASPETVQFRTPNAIMGVRGTEFVIEVGDEGAR